MIRIEPSAATLLAVIRRQAHRAELGTLVPQDCGRVWASLRASNLPGGRNVAVYWDATIRLEVGVEIAASIAADGEVVVSALPQGTVATTTHIGPYAELGSTHDAIRRWCTDHGHRLAGPSWEVYGHWREEWNTNPRLIQTDIFYQVVET